MSLSRFVREHGRAMRLGDESDLPQRTEDAYVEVRDRWLADRDYLALVKAIVGNWTSGNCVEFMLPVTQALIAANELELHQHLWTRTIKRQTQGFFLRYSFIRNRALGFQDIFTTESEGFDWATYTDERVAAAYLLKDLVRDLRLWKLELEDANLSKVEADRVEGSIRQLKPPRIEVNRLSRGGRSVGLVSNHARDRFQ